MLAGGTFGPALGVVFPVFRSNVEREVEVAEAAAEVLDAAPVGEAGMISPVPVSNVVAGDISAALLG